MSGAGSIKYDGSDEHNIYEIKTTGKGSFILKAKDLQDSFKYANKQDKTMVWVIEFLEHDLVVYVFPSRTFEI